MKRDIINSGGIVSMGYGIFSSKLEIEFETGEIIQFKKVPLNIFDGFKNAKCYFEYYEKNIKGIFAFNSVEEKF